MSTSTASWRVALVLVALAVGGAVVARADEAVSRSITVVNVGGGTAPPGTDEALARAVTGLNVGGETTVPALTEAVARAATALNVGGETLVSALTEALARAVTGLNVGGETTVPAFTEALARAVTGLNVGGETPVPALAEAIARAVTGHNLGPGAIDVPVDSIVVVAFALHPSYPNPLSRFTIVRYDLPHPSPIVLAVYDVAGRRVRTLVDSPRQKAGMHMVPWDGRSASGSEVGAGIYFLRMVAGEFAATRRVMVLRE